MFFCIWRSGRGLLGRNFEGRDVLGRNWGGAGLLFGRGAAWGGSGAGAAFEGEADVVHDGGFGGFVPFVVTSGRAPFGWRGLCRYVMLLLEVIDQFVCVC